MKIAVTAATGQLGQLIIKDLLSRGVASADITAVVRNPDKAALLAQQGITIRQADYNSPEALTDALAGVERILLISGNEPDRTEQHRNIVEAGRAGGANLIVYTSGIRAASSKLRLAGDHRATEDMVRDSGIPFVILQNGWYNENYTRTLPQVLERGVMVGSAGEGRVSAASRADYAEAAAAVLTGEGHGGKVYELGGDESFTLSDLAAVISEQSGKPVSYRNLPGEAHVQVLAGAGLPGAVAAALADVDRAIAEGELFTDSGDLSRLVGHPTTPIAETVAAAVQYLPQR